MKDVRIDRERLRGLRLGKGLSINQLATKVAHDKKTIGELESRGVGSERIVADVARFFGVPVEDLLSSEQRCPGPGNREAEALRLRRSCRPAMTELMALLYRRDDPENFCLPETIPVLCHPSFLPDRPLDVAKFEAKESLIWEPPPRDPPASSAFVPILQGADPNGHLYDGFLYRLVAMDDGPRFHFCPGSYYSFVETCEVLSYELALAMVDHPEIREIIEVRSHHRYPDALALLEKKKAIPLRRRAGPLDFSARHTAFGTATLVIHKRSKKPPLFIMNVRSTELSETPGLKHVIPAGTFQPNVLGDQDHDIEFSFKENIIREFAEELLGDPGLRSEGGFPLDVNEMYGERARRFRSLVRDRDVVDLLYLGTVVDPLNLKPEIITILMVHDAFLQDYRLNPSWESVSNSLQSLDFTREGVENQLANEELVPTGKAHLQLVLRYFDDVMERLHQL